MFKKFLFVAAVALSLSFAAQAADFSKLPNPMENVKAGQWVSYKQMGGMEMKQSITAVEGSGDDRVITLKIEMKQGDVVLPAQEQKISLKDSAALQAQAQAASADATITDTKVTVNGKEYNAVLVENTQQGMTSKIWMSKDIPVTGILKMEMEGMPEPMMELVDFGN